MKLSTQNPRFPMLGYGEESFAIAFLLGAICIESFGVRPTYPAWSVLVVRNIPAPVEFAIVGMLSQTFFPDGDPIWPARRF
jgi:hypothetical protein